MLMPSIKVISNEAMNKYSQEAFDKNKSRYLNFYPKCKSLAQSFEGTDPIFTNKLLDCIGGRIINKHNKHQIVFHINPEDDINSIRSVLETMNNWIKKEREYFNNDLSAFVTGGANYFQKSQDLFKQVQKLLQKAQINFSNIALRTNAPELFSSKEKGTIKKDLVKAVDVLFKDNDIYLSFYKLKGNLIHQALLSFFKDTVFASLKNMALTLVSLYSDMNHNQSELIYEQKQIDSDFDIVAACDSYNSAIMRMPDFNPNFDLYAEIENIDISSPEKLKQHFNEVTLHNSSKLNVG